MPKASLNMPDGASVKKTQAGFGSGFQTRGRKPLREPRRDIASLYKERAAKLTAGLRKRFGDGPPDPEDVAHEAFQKLIERGGHADIRDLNAFLWRTARNLIINARRAQDVRSTRDYEIEQLFFPMRGGDPTPETVLGAREELQAVNEALRAMPEKRRRAFLLHRIEGLAVVEVARRLRISRSPAQRHIDRAAADIQIRLARLRRDEET